MQTKKILKYIINTILISLILAIFICIIIEKIEDDTIKKINYDSTKLSIENNTNVIDKQEIENVILVEVKEYPKEEILDTYKGYEVCAKLEIPTISLQANILSKYTKEALKVSATKFWGVEPNENGNFCVAGHNTKSMFSGIKQLELGDILFISDRKIGKVEYEIFSIEKVAPENVGCLDALTDNEREVTLITCTNDSQKRVIIKAKEKVL